MGQVLALADLAPRVAAMQAQGKRVVLTNGVFDLLHLGHVRYLQQARALGDLLVVALNSDASTRRLKGPARPLVTEAERAEVLAALCCVEYVTIFSEDTAADVVAALRPAVYVKGGDYSGADIGVRALDAVLTPAEVRASVNDAPGARLPGLARRLPEARVVAAYGGEVALLAYLPEHSTTALLERIRNRNAEPDIP